MGTVDPLSVLIGTWLLILVAVAYRTLWPRPFVEPRATQAPLSDHEIRLTKLETKTKALSDEWENKLIQYDSLVRRLVRQKVLTEKAAEVLKGDGEDQAQVPLSAMRVTRSQLYARYRARREEAK